MNQPSGSEGRILVADDDEDIRTLIREQLEREPYEVRTAGDIAGARAALAEAPVDVLVLDLNLPDGDGVTLCRELRAEGHGGAIIMVTARDAAIDRVLGLELGADDYLTKPFEPRELRARVRNLIRRLKIADGGPRNARVAHIGPWRLDLIQRRLIASDDRLVMLASSEYRLLTRFLAAPNRVLSREHLLPERSATVAFDRSIDLQVSRLRQKLASEPGGADLILTVRNEGYVLAGEIRFE
ncbi:two-component system, OmpR family, response regulator [Enhydrobacter aerosaccus]|uniref:Two-component system, OmpR family, response regulator n=1 Tax=Enhydrobacter aerosaccus TaxID=225324 RepID=A0A1T4TJN1_9HYPH|nr:response regulator transcription factor [Enhydrobacter aerosaccus]SKA40655.1 two-component system, OmpR family, response regulator [Enhydrobacter aerosaccus]